MKLTPKDLDFIYDVLVQELQCLNELDDLSSDRAKALEKIIKKFETQETKK